MRRTNPIEDGARANERDARVHAVLAKDASMRGRFVYAVVTTGIYCAPGCASRTPKRDHIRIYSSPAEARLAGYRACKRCVPDRTAKPDGRVSIVETICAAIDTSESEPPLGSLAREVGRSPAHMQRVFKKATGLSPRDYAREVRARRARDALLEGESVIRAAYRAGYGSPSRFYDDARRALGMLPRIYRDKGARETIHFTFAHSTLGWVLVAATAMGVCAVSLGNEKRALARELRERFCKARVVRDDEGLAALAQAVVGAVEHPEDRCALPLDLRGTLFQSRVWHALRSIPPGETRTYAEIALSIGSPRAARAVGRACAQNGVAALVPCHRAVGKGGTLTGYRWGTPRKSELLSREAAAKARRS